MKELLQRLTDTFSPSGYEEAVRALIRKEVRDLADEVRVDALGNLLVRKGRISDSSAPRHSLRSRGGVRSGKRIMIAAHMDEIGLMATHVDERGFVRFTSIGGVYPRNLPGGRVRFANGTLGVIGLEPT